MCCELELERIEVSSSRKFRDGRLMFTRTNGQVGRSSDFVGRPSSRPHLLSMYNRGLYFGVLILCLFSSQGIELVDRFSLCQSVAIPSVRAGADCRNSLTVSLAILLIYWFTGRSSSLKKDIMGSANRNYRFEAVPGYFMQDEPETDPNTFDYVRQPPSISRPI